MTISVFILAGGDSHRFPGYSAQRPKCLIPFGNESLLNRHIRALDDSASDTRIVVSVRCAVAAIAIREEARSKGRKANDVQVCINDDHRHGVLPAFSRLLTLYQPRGPVVLALSDMLYLGRSFELLLPFEGTGVGLLVSSHPHSRTGSAVQRNGDGAVIGLSAGAAHGVVEQWCGAAILGPQVVSAVAEEVVRLKATGPSVLEEDLINALFRNGVQPETVETGVCINVNTPGDLSYASELDSLQAP